ncbi:MAG: holo-ACP synthase [bacterium]
MVGVGTDIVEIARIAAVLQRYRERFLQRCFTPGEIALARSRQRGEAAALAARWAAKEAFLKALGRPLGSVAMREIEVIQGRNERPVLSLSGRAATALRDAGGRKVHLSLSHERDYATAVVLVE